MIAPALLTDKKDSLGEMMKLCAEFTDYIQIDIMDGEFVPSKSVTLEDLKDLSCPVRSEAHLMVLDPLAWLDSFKKLGSEKIIYSFEIKKDHQEIISQVRAQGLKVGLAINPSSSIDNFRFLVDKVDSILFMSVNPGFYGAKFIPEVLEKIRDFRSQYPNKSIGIDGGIKLDNARLAKEAGANCICVGSAILKSQNPAQSYQSFVKLLND